MNSRFTARRATFVATLALAVLGSASAMAQDTGLSRADVQAQVTQARASGELGQAYGYQFNAPAFVATQDRADVKSAVVQARADRTLDNPGERYGFVVPTANNSAPAVARSRSDVKAEVLAAVRRGERFGTSETY